MEVAVFSIARIWISFLLLSKAKIEHIYIYTDVDPNTDVARTFDNVSLTQCTWDPHASTSCEHICI